MYYRVGRDRTQGLLHLFVDRSKSIAEGYECLGYEHDLAIIVRGKYAETVTNRTQGALNLVKN